ncbi:MAG: hypothetical protein M3040_09130 [Bacteroidota bacterium]|nr:hypothetical protein [Bacteroidota bacterium]
MSILEAGMLIPLSRICAGIAVSSSCAEIVIVFPVFENLIALDSRFLNTTTIISPGGHALKAGNISLAFFKIDHPR